MPSETNRTILERLDAESRSLAKKIDDVEYFYYLYGLLDGLSLTYSMVKYFFDLKYDGHSSGAVEEWLGTSTGVAIAATETITLVTLSLLANVFDDNDQNKFKRYIAIVWPYFRDSMKGLKNAFKGIRSTFQAVGILSGHDLQYLILPVGVALGVISVWNRVWMRAYVKEPRIAKQKENEKILEKIKGSYLHTLNELPNDLGPFKNSYILVKNALYFITSHGFKENVPLTSREVFEEGKDDKDGINKLREKRKKEEKFYLTDEEIKTLITDNGGYTSPAGGYNAEMYETFRGELKLQKEQFESLKSWAFLSAGYAGVVDGLYLYMGALGLTILSPPVFMAMTVCSAIFSVMCVVTRVYEEYEYQRKLEATQARVEVALCAKELESILEILQWLSNPCNQNYFTLNELQDISGRLRSAYSSIIDDTIERKLTDIQTKLDQQSVDDLVELLREVSRSALIPKKNQLLAARAKLHDTGSSSDKIALFIGFRHGLAFYGAITSIMFAVATINAIFLISFPSSFLIAGVVSGMLCMLAFLIHSLVYNAPSISGKNQGNVNDALETQGSIGSLLESIKSPNQALPQDLESQAIKLAAYESMKVEVSPKYYVWEWCEIVRSLGSGFSKWPKLLDFLQNMWSGVENDTETPIFFRIAIIGAVAQGLAFAIRALGRNLGREDAVDVPPLTPGLKSPEREVDRGPSNPKRHSVSKGSESSGSSKSSSMFAFLFFSNTTTDKSTPRSSDGETSEPPSPL